MAIDINDIIEFSKIYKRVMDIELKLKEKLKFALHVTFPNRMFYRLTPFILKNFTGRYTEGFGKKSRDLLIDLVKSKKIEEEKLNQFVNMAYLSDLLKILTDEPAIYRDMNFNKNFYCQNVLFNDLKKYASLLKKLRNAIMHFDINTYKQNKIAFINALGYWELQLNCSKCFIHNLPAVTPKITPVLNLLALHNPDFFSLSDRIVCDIFDEVAFLNGREIKDLPEYWSIVRAYYELKRKHNK
ncbi:hypothetical protein J6E39_07520 [bacterium]|nr:hypothetical protein [bacterium]